MHVLIRRSAPLAAAMAVTFALIAPLAGAAQDDSESTATDGVGVARISLIEGNVALQRGDSTDSLAAAPNAPVLGGDYVTTGDSSRAEIQLDGYSQVRLGQDVQMRFTHLDTTNRSLQLAAGTVDLRLLQGNGGASAIDTPSITVKPQQSGSYRVTVTPDGQTLVTVRSGDARIETPQGAQDLTPGTTLTAQGEAANPSVTTQAAVALDDFDHFNTDRDRVDAPAVADAGYVNENIEGVGDLNNNGRWVTDGSYGHVWVPASVGPDWAPYRNGRWVWEDGYGWTWIADESWGWAPYHYGSWYNSPSYGWCWYPPQPHVYVPWRPALVAFIGFGAGSGFSLSFGGGGAFGNIGWVPLAPFEPYHPWWGDRYGYRGGTVVNNITNITNVTNVTNINVYKNVRYNAVSSVTSQRFLQGNFTRNVAMTAPQLREAQVFRGALPVVPTASNLRFSSNAAAPAVAVRPALMQRSFAGNVAVVHRTPFTTQRVALATATHTAVTPLNFKDAETTPIVNEHAATPGHAADEHAVAPGRPAAEHAAGPAVPSYARPLTTGERPATTVERPATTVEHPTATIAHPTTPAVEHPAAANPWARFHDARPTDSMTTGHAPAPAAAQTLHHATPTVTDERTQSGATINRAPTAPNDFHPAATVNHAPTAPNDDHPATTIDRAPTTAKEYHQPTAPSEFHAPAAPTQHAPSATVAPAHPAHVTAPANDSQWHRYNDSHPTAPHTAPAPHAPPAPAAKSSPAHPSHDDHEKPHPGR